MMLRRMNVIREPWQVADTKSFLQKDSQQMDDGTTRNSDPEVFDLDLSDLEEPTPSEAVRLHPTPFSAAIEKAANVGTRSLAAAESRDTAAEIEASLASVAEQMLSSAVARNSRLANFGVNLKVTTYRKAPAGLYKEPGLLVRGWLELPQKISARTGKQIIERLQKTYQPHIIRKDFMSRRLHWAQSKHLRSMLVRAGIATKLADCQTLSRVRTHIKNHYTPPEYEICKTVVQFATDGSHVIWNGKRYSVFLNGGVPTIKRNDKRIAISAIRRVLG